MFGLGAQAYAGHRDKSTIEDRLHFFTEECDNLQVLPFFQVLCFFFDPQESVGH